MMIYLNDFNNGNFSRTIGSRDKQKRKNRTILDKLKTVTKASIVPGLTVAGALYFGNKAKNKIIKESVAIKNVQKSNAQDFIENNYYNRPRKGVKIEDLENGRYTPEFIAKNKQKPKRFRKSNNRDVIRRQNIIREEFKKEKLKNPAYGEKMNKFDSMITARQRADYSQNLNSANFSRTSGAKDKIKRKGKQILNKLKSIGSNVADGAAYTVLGFGGLLGNMVAVDKQPGIKSNKTGKKALRRMRNASLGTIKTGLSKIGNSYKDD